MPIREKIEKPKIDMNKLREKVISRGGHVTADMEENKKKWMNFCLRIKVEMLDQIDKIVEERAGISKTGWILEAIQEKLKACDERKNKI